MKISVCIIVKNEEKCLATILNDASEFADEIVIVDTGSTDKTKEIAKKYTDKVFDYQWTEDFGSARNFSFSKATCDYIMWLDADDKILSEDIKKIQNLKKKKILFDAYRFFYVSSYDKSSYKVKRKFYRIRLIKNNHTNVWKDPIHEYIDFNGNIANLNINIYHEKQPNSPERNLKIYQKMISENITFTPRQQFYYGKELFENKYYNTSKEVLSLLVKSKTVWKEERLQAYLLLSKIELLQGNELRAMLYLFRTFTFTKPRAEVLCEISNIFIKAKQYTKALWWSSLALKSKHKKNFIGYTSEECYNEIPKRQIEVCKKHI